MGEESRRVDRGAAPEPIWRFVVRHWVLGGAVGAAAGGLMLATDTMGLWTLTQSVETPEIAVFLLVFSLAATFGGVVAAQAVMGSGDPDDRRG